MKERRRNIMVGLFVFVGLVALGVLVVMFGQGPQWLMARDSLPVIIQFDSVAGIREGTHVTVRGKRIGHVEQIRFAAEDLRGGVEVVAAIDQEYLEQIPADSRAETVEAGLIGGGRPPIDIVLGTSANSIAPGGTIRGITAGALDAIVPEEMLATLDRTVRQVGNAAGTLEPVLRDLGAILEPRTPQAVDAPAGPPGNLSSAVTRLDRVFKNVNDVLGAEEEQSKLQAAIENAYELSEKLLVVADDFEVATADAKRLMEKSNTTVEHLDQAIVATDKRLETIATALIEDLQRAGAVLDYLNDSAAAVASGEGTLGRLVHDDELYEVLVLSGKRLATALEELRILIVEWQAGRIRVAF